MSLRALVVCVALTGLGASALGAEMKWVTRPDGTRVLIGKGTPTGKFSPRPPTPELLEKVEHYARAVDLDSKLVQCLIQAESGFDPRAVSVKGAQGLMQLMPATANQLGVENSFDIDQNLQGGTRYLKQLLDRYNGDLTLGLAAYNAGPQAVQRYGGVPPYRETRGYIRRVLTMYRGSPPTIPPAGSLRGRPAYLVRKDGRWLVTSDRRAAESADKESAAEARAERRKTG